MGAAAQDGDALAALHVCEPSTPEDLKLYSRSGTGRIVNVDDLVKTNYLLLVVFI